MDEIQIDIFKDEIFLFWEKKDRIENNPYQFFSSFKKENKTSITNPRNLNYYL